MNRKLLICVFLYFVGIGLYAQENADVVKVGDDLPSFKINTSNGEITSQGLIGKVSLINFFATWCPSCVKELPHLEKKVWGKYQDNPDFELLVIGREHSEQEMDLFAKEKYTMPIYGDEHREVYKLFAENTIPRSYIVDKKGKVVYMLTGYSEEAFKEMLTVLENLLN